MRIKSVMHQMAKSRSTKQSAIGGVFYEMRQCDKQDSDALRKVEQAFTVDALDDIVLFCAPACSCCFLMYLRFSKYQCFGKVK